MKVLTMNIKLKLLNQYFCEVQFKVLKSPDVYKILKHDFDNGSYKVNNLNYFKKACCRAINCDQTTHNFNNMEFSGWSNQIISSFVTLF